MSMHFHLPHFLSCVRQANHPTGQPVNGSTVGLANRTTGKLANWRTRESARSRAGSALVIVLGLLAVLLLMGVAFSVTMRTERSGASNMRHAAMARHTLDSAIARVMSDLDAELASYEKNGRFYGNLTPTNMVVATSLNDAGGSPNVSVLSHEIARHLPSDQLAAALDAEAQWVPIYGAVRVSDEGTDPTAEDPPVGRYAYIVLNNSGYLDPNTVGRTNRFVGLSTAEIQLGPSDRANLLNVRDPDIKSVEKFKNQIQKDGHYVTMRDFLHEKINTIIGNKEIKPGKGNSAMYSFSTNSFAVGSMAIDDLTPPVKVGNSYIDDPDDGDPVVYRLPKVSLTDADGKLLSPSDLDATTVAEAFRRAFESTMGVAGDKKGYALPETFLPGGNSERVKTHHLAMRSLFEALDDDFIPGGTTPHNTSGGDSLDPYLHSVGEDIDWDCLPCTEPVPMLDNLFFVAGNRTTPGMTIELKKTVDPETGNSVVTGAVCHIIVSAVKLSAYFAGWNCPNKKDHYAYTWHFSGAKWSGAEECSDKVLMGLRKGITKLVPGNPSLPRISSDFSFHPEDGHIFRQEDSADSWEEILHFDIPLPLPESGGLAEEDFASWIPESFGCTVQVTGWMSEGTKSDAEGEKNMVQVVPAGFSRLRNGDEPEGLSIPLLFDKEKMWVKNWHGTTSPAWKDDDSYVLGGAMCIDPMFGYSSEAWITSIDWSEKDNDQDALTKFKKEHLPNSTCSDWVDGRTIQFNSYAEEYLKNPYEYWFDVFRDGVIGGCSDIMWANPNAYTSKQEADNYRLAALAFYFDPKSDADSPYHFNRVGQLGFLPIGMYKTIALLDGFCLDKNKGNAEIKPTDFFRVPRQCVLDYFTMSRPRDKGSSGQGNKPGAPVKTEIFQSRLNLNPPRNIHWEQDDDGEYWLESDRTDYNLLPITAALTGCPLVEWDKNNSYAKPVDWDTAEKLAKAYAENISRTDDTAREECEVKCWNSDGAVRDLSVLGRCGVFLDHPSENELKDDPSWDTILRKEKSNQDQTCDFFREGIVRNSAGMFTARQQLFTILLKADSFTPKFGFNDAEHGTSLASVEAIAHVWRDPDPLRDADGKPVRDWQGNPIHPWVLLDVYQF